MCVGWNDFEVDVADESPCLDCVLDCDDERLNRDDVDGLDDEDGGDWGAGSGS